LLAPPASPALVRPRAAHRAEHVAAQNPSTDAGEALYRHLVIDARFAPFHAMHLAPHSRRDEPFHKLGAANTERILQVLIRSSSVAIDRDAKALHTKFRQVPFSSLLAIGGRHVKITTIRRRSPGPHDG